MLIPAARGGDRTDCTLVLTGHAMKWCRGLFRRGDTHDDQAGDKTRYVVSIRMTGLGDRLICLGAAWRFATNTGRTLVADWRHGAYAQSTHQNVFGLCFKPSSELAGVKFIGDNRIRDLRLPRPRHPSLWNDDGLLQAAFRRPTDTILAHRDAAVTLIRSGSDVDAPTVVFDSCINDGLVSVVDSRTFLSSLRPRDELTKAATRFRQQYLGTAPAIGLHVRHGNRAPTGHVAYWSSFEAAIDRCTRAVNVARERVGRHAPVLLCTDSVEVEAALRARIRDIASRSKLYRKPGTGELHFAPHGRRILEDAMVDMLLLAESLVLIRYPPGSFFSFYPAVMRHGQEPAPASVYDLLQPYDPGDPLSPALLR